VLPCSNRAARCAACSHTGVEVIAGPCQELLRIGVGSRSVPAATPCHGFHDPDLSAAAYAAECQAARQSTASLSGRASGGAVEAGGLAGLLKSTLKFPLEAGWGAGGGDPVGLLHARPGSHLFHLFSGSPPVPQSSPFSWECIVGSPRSRSPKTAVGQGGAGRGEASARSAPLPRTVAGARAAAGGALSGAGVVTRTPSEIRRAYGKPDVGGVKEVMGDNVAKLHARGERLQGLEAKMEDFSHQAEGFAALTKKLEEESRKSKWWKPFS
jgi:hypothetical protein